MKPIRIFSPTLILFLISNLLCEICSQQDSIKFKSLSFQDGVAHNLTYSMMKDSKGFLWFGTMYGLAKYEGSGYIVFKNDPDDPNSISFDDIISLHEDKNGNIWIGTWGGGLNKYDPFRGEFTRFMYQEDNPDGINDNIIWAICEDKNGNIWLGTESGGLNVYNPQTGKFTHYKSDESNPNSINSNTILSLFCDSNGYLWAGSNAGLSKFNYEGSSFKNFTNIPDDKNSISGGVVRVIYEDKDKNLWIGTASGLNKFDGTNFKKYYAGSNTESLSNNFIISVTEDSKGYLWIGTRKGLNRFNKTTEEFTRFFHKPGDPSTISGNVIYNIIEDKSGALWVNSYSRGIDKSVKTSPVNFYNIGNFPNGTGLSSQSNIISLTETKDGNLCIGTMSGLNFVDPADRKVEHINISDTPRDNIISALAIDTDGNIWIGSYNGLRLFNPSSGKFLKPGFKKLKETGLLSSHITAFLIDSLNVWVGTYSDGLFMLDRKNNSFSKFSFEGKHFNNYQANYILTLYKDTSGKIWVGSYGGLMLYDKNEKSFKSYTNNQNNKHSVSNNYIFSIFESSRNELWIGTSNGLNKLIPGSSSFEHFFEKDGLPNSVICAINEDNYGNLWISTNKGLSKFNYNQKSFTNYDITNGLGGNLFNPSVCVKGKNNSLAFGGNWGLTVFYPEEMSFSNYNPPVYISSVKKINTDGKISLITSFNEEIEINYSEKTIVVNFASLDYSNPSKNRFMYIMEGIDKEWVNAGNRNFATYTNLEPGIYTLKVKGTNSDGVFSSYTAGLSIIVIPPFWQTLWFQVSVVILVILIIFFLVRTNVKTKIKRAIEIQKIREEESAKTRRQAAIDFHDELGHKLTRISLLTEMIRKKLQNTFNDVDPFLKKISDNSHSLYEGTRDFIWSIEPGGDSLFDLMTRLKDFGDELFADTNIKFNLKGVNEQLQKFPLTIEWKRHVTLIFKEAMNNTLKYSDSKNATLSIEIKDKKELEIFLFDDGKGFEPERHYDGNGLKNMKTRAKKINGILDIDSRSNIGTKILFKGIFPINYLDYN